MATPAKSIMAVAQAKNQEPERHHMLSNVLHPSVIDTSPGDSVRSSRHRGPSPIPLYLESKVQNAFPDATKKPDKDEPISGEAGHAHIDRLLDKASKVLDADSRVRSKKLEQSLQIQRNRAERRRQYDYEKEHPPIPHWVAEAEAHKAAPLKTLDEWLGYNGPKLRSSTRELEKQPTIDSFLPRMRENHSQYDSEARANLMVRNSEKLKSVEEKLGAIATRGRHHEGEEETADATYSPEELLGKLSPDDLKAIQQEFASAGGTMDFTPFVELMQGYLPADAWKDTQTQVSNIMDLCQQLDMNGDSVVSWDEMFEFTVEMGKNGSKAWEKLEDMILAYLPTKPMDKRGEVDNRSGFKDGEIERVQCLQAMDKIAVLERDSPVIKLYNAETLELTDCLDGHKGAVLRCIHLEGTDYVVSSGADTSLIFWGAFTNNKRQVLPTSEVFMSLVWDLSRRMLYAGSSGGTVHCFTVPDVTSVSGTIGIAEEKRFAAHTDVVTDMLVMPDLGLLVTSSMDAKMLVWDLGVHTPRRTLNAGHKKGIYTLAYIPSQRYLLSAGYDHYCKVWNPMIEEPLFTMHGHTSIIAGLEVVLGSNRVITADVDGVVKVWDIRNFSCVQTVKIDNIQAGSVADVTYVARMDRFAVAAVGQVSRRVHKLFCLDYEHPMQPEVADEEPVVCSLYSRVNHTITTASARTVRLWNASTGLLTKSFVNVAQSNITAMCFDERERKMVIGEENGSICVVNFLNGALMKRLEPHDADVCALAYCAFSKCIVSASWGGRVRVHLLDKAQVLRQIDGHSSDVTCMAYSTPLSLICTACTGGGVRLWDYEDAKMAGSCQAHTTEVTIAEFVEEYRCLLTGDFLGNLILWTVAPWKEKHKPVARWTYMVQDEFDAALWRRDTPTACAFHPASHTLFIGGSMGHIVAYDTTAVMEELIAWQGVDESGRSKGPLIVPVPPRLHFRNPREGRTKVPEARREGDGQLDEVIRASNDPSFDVAGALEWGKDVMTGQMLSVRLGPDGVAARRCWRAHTDAVKSMQMVQETVSGEERAQLRREAGPTASFDAGVGADALKSFSFDATSSFDSARGDAASFFLTQDPSQPPDAAPAHPPPPGGRAAGGGVSAKAPSAAGGDRKPPSKFQRGKGGARGANKKPPPPPTPKELACILTCSHDQTVCIWGTHGNKLGSLRQGDRLSAKHWSFPITSSLVSSRKEKETGQMLGKPV